MFKREGVNTKYGKKMQCLDAVLRARYLEYFAVYCQLPCLLYYSISQLKLWVSASRLLSPINASFEEVSSTVPALLCNYNTFYYTNSVKTPAPPLPIKKRQTPD